MLTSAERKARSEEICRRENIPVNPHLPLVEDELASTLRSLEEVAWRAMCLCLVAMKGEGMEQPKVIEIITELGLANLLTPQESNFVFGGESSQEDFSKFSWRYESYWVLLWALGYLNELGKPDQVCDVERAVKTLWEYKRPELFIAKAKLRAHSEILDELDLVYRYDWACVDARLKGEDIPGKLHAGVVYERHYAFNWLVSYMEQEWDDVSTDT